MRTTAVFFAFLTVCLLLAALATPPLVASGWVTLEPHRLMGRLAQLFILLGIWPLLAWLGVLDRVALGYGAASHTWWRAAGWGWLAGVAILLVLLLTLLGLEVRLPDTHGRHWTTLLQRCAQALFGGMLVGLVEETFFRGALFSAIRRRDGVGAAMLWSSVLYALLHFMKPGELPAGVAFDWDGSLRMVAGVFVDLFQWRHLDSLVALGLAGLLLAQVREWSGHIGWCVGLHAGWVLVIQLGRTLTDGNPGSPLAGLVGDYDGTIGWLAAAWLGLLSLGLGVLLAARRRPGRAADAEGCTDRLSGGPG